MVDNRKVDTVVLDDAPNVDYVEIEGDFPCDMRTGGSRRPYRMLVADVNVDKGKSWTLSLIGPAETVTARRAAFLPRRKKRSGWVAKSWTWS